MFREPIGSFKNRETGALYTWSVVGYGGHLLAGIGDIAIQYDLRINSATVEVVCWTGSSGGAGYATCLLRFTIYGKQPMWI